MSDYSEQGAVPIEDAPPIEDAAVADPPTVDEVLARQREQNEPTAGDGVPSPELADGGIASLVNNTGLDGDAASG